MQFIKKHFERDRFVHGIGIETVEVKPGYARARLQITERHHNSIGIAQGGAIFTLADFAFALASNSHGQVAVGINTNMSFVKAVTSGILTAEAVEESLNPKIATYNVKVTDENDETVALFQGMVYRKKDRIEDLYPSA